MLRGKIVLDIYSIRYVNTIISFSGNPDVNRPIPGGWQAYWSPDGCRTGYRQLLPEVLIPWWEWRSGVSRGELPWRRPPETAHNISASCKTTENFLLAASRTQLQSKQMHEEFESVMWFIMYFRNETVTFPRDLTPFIRQRQTTIHAARKHRVSRQLRPPTSCSPLDNVRTRRL